MRLIALSVASVLSICVSVNAQTFEEVCTQQSPPVLTANGSRLFVNGQPRFLVLASYFDAMRPTLNDVKSDFALLKSKGLDGVRIFPLWADGGSPPVMLLQSETPEGSFRYGMLNRFKAILEAAGQCGFVVDVSINREMDENPGLSVVAITGNASDATCLAGPPGTTGIPEIVCAIRGSAYTHVFMDLQNERDSRDVMKLTVQEVNTIRGGVKLIDPSRLVMTSHSSDQGAGTVEAEKSRDLAFSAPLDVVAYHAPQEAGWYSFTLNEVRKMRATARPVYIQEGARRDRGVECGGSYPDGNPFVKAATAAKLSGAAAWTFHTDAAHHLNLFAFQPRLGQCAVEMSFLNQFRAILDADVGWSTLGDHDRDGQADFIVWTPSTATWSGVLSGNLLQPASVQFGTTEDTPVRADYDGDGIEELAVYHYGPGPSGTYEGQWTVACSSVGGGHSSVHLRVAWRHSGAWRFHG